MKLNNLEFRPLFPFSSQCVCTRRVCKTHFFSLAEAICASMKLLTDWHERDVNVMYSPNKRKTNACHQSVDH